LKFRDLKCKMPKPYFSLTSFQPLHNVCISSLLLLQFSVEDKILAGFLLLRPATHLLLFRRHPTRATTAPFPPPSTPASDSLNTAIVLFILKIPVSPSPFVLVLRLNTNLHHHHLPSSTSPTTTFTSITGQHHQLSLGSTTATLVRMEQPPSSPVCVIFGQLSRRQTKTPGPPLHPSSLHPQAPTP
jgi:hypothetical protein